MKHSLIYLLGAFCIMTACIEEQSEMVIPTPGEDIKFYADLNSVKTKTLYGDEVVNKDGQATAIKVNWVDGDLISVYGPNCLDGRKQGQYEVTSAGSYASDLQMVGDHGVQWGNVNSDFYAVYPSVPDGAFSHNPQSGTISVSTSIRSEQKNVFEKIVDENGVVTWVGTPYIDVTSNSVTTKSRTMPDALMYAYTKGWDDDSKTGVKNGETVNLKFTPFATVLKFKLEGWAPTVNLQDPIVYVQKITVTAPSTVALVGDCVFTFEQGTPTATKGASTSNVITINPVLEGANFLPLNKKQHVEFNVFAIPLQEQALSGDWNIKLETTHGNFQFKLNPKESDKASLMAGQIHQINVPELQIKTQFTYDPENWIEAIPRNIYLSELSVPGAWYCMDPVYQGALGFGETTNVTVGNRTISVDAGLKKLHDAGVRAFHFDCRLTLPGTGSTSDSGAPSAYTGTEAQNKSLKLVIAGTDAGGNATEVGSYKGGTELLGALQSLGELTIVNPKEYTVVVLTIAEKAVSRSGAEYGTVSPNLVLPAIYSVINSNKEKLPLYINKTVTDSNGNETIINGINKDVTVNDVLGKMILIINTNTTQANFSSFGDVPALIATASMATSNDSAQGIVSGDFDSMVDDYPLFWSNSNTSVLNYYYHIGQGSTTRSSILGTGFPRVSARQTAVQDIINQSYTLWQNGEGAHDSWFLLGIGGYVKNSTILDSEDHSALARQMNAYVLEQINTKLNMNDAGSTLLPSPVGIVLMNFCTSNNTNASSGNGNGAALVKAIIEMNGKFELVRNPNAEEWPND